MKDIKNVLNKVGNFSCCINEEIIEISGFLTYESKNIVFKGSLNLEYIKKLKKNHICQLYGAIEGIKVTLINAFLNFHYTYSHGDTDVSISAEPSEIVLGRSYSSSPEITQISASINALNNMFSIPPLQERVDFSKDDPSLLSYTYPEPIRAKDDIGEISLYQTFSIDRSRGKIEFPIIPMIEYRFFSPKNIKEAIAHIASFRNLLTFFADYYLPIENISFADEASEKMAKENDRPTLCDCSLHLNYTENIEHPYKPFVISTNEFGHNFQEVWTNWCAFYNTNKHIGTLFYEIVCNRSTHVNCFLNLIQAIEIYSVNYKDMEAKQLGERDGCKRRRLPLKYRMEDILTMTNDCLNIPPDKIRLLSKEMSSARNFFTHFNIEEYREPSFQEIAAASRLLHIILLAIVYKTIGITDEQLKSCLVFKNKSITRDISIFLREKEAAFCTTLSE